MLDNYNSAICSVFVSLPEAWTDRVLYSSDHAELGTRESNDLRGLFQLFQTGWLCPLTFTKCWPRKNWTGMVNKNLEFWRSCHQDHWKARDCQFQLVLLDTWGIGWHRETTRAPCLVLQFQNATRPLKYGSLQQSQALGVSNAHEAPLIFEFHL